MIVPVLRFDSRERFFPVGVEESLALYGYKWNERSGLFDRPDDNKWDLRSLDFPPHLERDENLRKLPPVAYHRVVQGGGLWWSQFWLWYVHNPWSIAGVGEHEGDWEMVQLGCADREGDHPVLVTCSQHHSGGKREAWACEAAIGHPVVYVALGSHAGYFAAGSQGGGLDRCDGKGRTVAPFDFDVRPFGAWQDWPGRWGNSHAEGKSPESPARQGTRWHAPQLFHSAARS